MPGAKAPSPQRPSWADVDAMESMVSCEDVLFGVASVLDHFIVQSELSGKPGGPTPFDGPLAAPGSTVHEFLEHIMNSGLCSKECFIMSLVYGERILQRRADFTLNRNNVHRFVLTSILVGSKILDDFYCRNMYYAQAAGLEKAELNALELTLCDWLNFDLNVEPEEFAVYRDSLIRRSASVAAQAAAAAAAAATTLMATVPQQFALVLPPVSLAAAPLQHTFEAMPLPIESFGKPPQQQQQQQQQMEQQTHWSAEPPPPPASVAPPAAAHLGTVAGMQQHQQLWLDAIPPLAQQQQQMQQQMQLQQLQLQQQQQQLPVPQQHSNFSCGYVDPLGAARAWFSSGTASYGSMMSAPPAQALAPLMPHQAVSMSASMWAPQLHV